MPMSLLKIAAAVALLIIILTHVYMAVYGMPQSQVKAHALLNLAAALVILPDCGAGRMALKSVGLMK